jgi:antitoxin (DNA-binding transcriptional repressor) of toxin-antitoxin stability system
MKLFLMRILLCGSMALFLAQCADSSQGGGTETGNPVIVIIPTNQGDTQDQSMADSAGDVSDTRRYGESLASGDDGSLGVAETEAVITNTTALTTFWTNLLGDDEVPEVDFDTEMVVAVVMGVQSTDGYSLRIDSLRHEDGVLTVFIERISPGESCEVTEGHTNPYHIVSLPRYYDVVIFNYEDSTSTCD